MRTKELIKLVGQLEALYVKDHGDKLGFYEVGSDNPYFILPKLAEKWSDCKTNLRCISKAKLEILLDAGDHIVGYLNTPLAEREEEKRYWLRKIPVPLLKESDDLWYYEPINKLFKPGVDRDRTDNEKYKSIFTESEISQMDITGFEKEEVTE